MGDLTAHTRYRPVKGKPVEPMIDSSRLDAYSIRRCRKRKIRCNVDLPGRPCSSCRERKLHCESAGQIVDSQLRDTSCLSPSASKRGPLDSDRGRGSTDLASIIDTSSTQSRLLLNPTLAEDVEVLDRYLTSQAAPTSAVERPYKTISSDKGGPIVYLTVPRARKGLPATPSPGVTQREIMEQVLGPLKSEVIRLYFQRVHPCFPVLDEWTFTEMWHHCPDRLSSTLMCDIYAVSLTYWRSDLILQRAPLPDVTFAWNQAVGALQEDFLAPTISTVHAALLDLIGRPVLGITGNVVNCGRTVTLAHSLGLHRKPNEWKATAREKSVRTKLWWGVMIHDCWSSLAHGTPPTIQRGCHDVPIPSSPQVGGFDTHSRESSTFVHLCSLTQILSEILPLVYVLEIDVKNTMDTLQKLGRVVDEWEEHLPDNLKPYGSDHQSCDGVSSLWFCFLSIRLLLARLAVRGMLRDDDPPASEAVSLHKGLLAEAAARVADFTIALTDTQLAEFWLSYTTHLLVSATTILLRCTIETLDVEKKRVYTNKLIALRDRLKSSSMMGWDLADFCLERTSEAISRVKAAFESTLPARTAIVTDSQVVQNENLALPSTVLPQDPISTDDLFLPADSLDFPWEILWGDLEGPWPVNV